MDPVQYLKDLAPIVVLLVVIGIVLARLPRVEVGHTDAFRRRRFFNWFPLGLTYAFLYFGRYNLNSALSAKVLTEHDYGTIFAVGAWVYGVSFLVNGPLADRFGGRRTILIGAFGSATMNVLMGVAARHGYLKENAALVFSILYGVNMYFQSFGAVSIIKVNSAWFHVRERGVFGGIFGILISLGLYFAFDWCLKITKSFPQNIEYLFWIPGAVLFVFWAITFLVVRDTPGEAGHADFDPGDASSGDTGPRLPVYEVMRRMFSNRIIMIIAVIELCSGFLRDSMTHWYRAYAAAVTPAEELKQAFVYNNWGMLLCVAGILGGTFAGVISDRVFQSRRPPVAAVLYTIMLTGSLALLALLAFPTAAGWAIVTRVMSVLGVHGVLSGTASADFGGKKNAGIAVGIIDGFVYAGVGLQSLLLGNWLPQKGTEAAAHFENWRIWPAAMIPVAISGLALATRVWNAKPKAAAAPPVEGQPEGASKAPRRGSRATQPKILEQALELAKKAGQDGVVAFDLDSTLLDNRPRQATILREWAEQRGNAVVARTQPEHLDGWDLRVAMVNAGLSRADAEALYPDAKAFWRERFFTSSYCKLDVAIPGTREYLEALQATGVQIAYVTGRHEGMRDGTIESFSRAGFPLPDGARVQLFLKPKLEQDDDAWKVDAKALVRKLGRIVAAFDNEPVHINGYKEADAECLAVHLDVDHSGRPVKVLDSIPSVLDFVRA